MDREMDRMELDRSVGREGRASGSNSSNSRSPTDTQQRGHRGHRSDRGGSDRGKSDRGGYDRGRGGFDRGDRDRGRDYREPSRDYSRDQSRQYSREPNREYSREPNREYSREPNREYSREPNREYSREPNREYSRGSRDNDRQQETPSHAPRNPFAREFPSGNGNGNGNGIAKANDRPHESDRGGNRGGNGGAHEKPNGTNGGHSSKRTADDYTPAPKRPARGGNGGQSGETGDRSRKPRPDRYEIVRTRPDPTISKKGTTGPVTRLRGNFFELQKKLDWELCMYRVDFSPECENVATRKYLMYTQRDLFAGYLYDTKNSVYLTHRLPQDITVVNTEDRQKVPYQITIKYGTVVQMDTRESLQVLNLILRRAMEGLKLQLIGRNLFDAAGKIDFPNYRLQLWPGYTTSIRQHESSVMLCAEIASKVMRNETIYDILQQCGTREDFKAEFDTKVVGLVVLTDYNNKTYRIDEVDYAKTPADRFDTKDGSTSFVEYYKRKYNINIRNPTQPLLVSRSTERQRRGGQDELICLVPELCRPTGLTDRERNNWQLMKAVAEYTRMDPKKRMDALKRFNQRLHSTPASVEILRTWNFQLDRNLVSFDGRTLKNENIVYGQGEKEPSGNFADWQMSFKTKSMVLSYTLRNWCIIVPNKMRHEIDKFISDMERASRQMRFELGRPQFITLHDDRNQSYLQGFEDATARDPQLIMAFVPNNNADRYSSIKKMGCVNHSIPTQVVVQKTLRNKNLMSIATKVAIQLNCKLGGTPWLVEIPTKGLMTIGIDVSRDSKDKKISWGALVATMDLKNLQKESFFSTVSQHSNSDDFSTQLAIDVTKALTAYKSIHHALPDRICIYRDGVGEGQTKFIYETELDQIRSRLEEMYTQYGAGARLRLAFIIVSKKINTRIFTSNERNPQPGTVVDDVITLPERYDFYLVSQSVRQGTVSPTSYNVLYDTMGFNADKLQQLTYKQCHLYYNWAGTVRVPAVCQYAHKLSFLIAQCVHAIPSPTLEKKLYFL